MENDKLVRLSGVLDELNEWYDMYPDSDTAREALSLAKKSIRRFPAVDAVEVVRCGDCRWYDPRTKNCLDGLYGIFEPEWFCKDGQRREEADT